MGNFIDYNTSITKGAAEQASNAELAAKYKSMMADQAVGKHVEAAAMQAHDVGAAKGYEAGIRDGGLATLASMFPQAPAYNPFQMMAKNAEMQGLGGRAATDTGYNRAIDASNNGTVYTK